jgi:hypothetical protein
MMNMKLLKNRFGLLGLVLIGLACSGCLLISGTFIVVADFDFTTFDQYYHYSVDVTQESDWQDHKDNIDFVDAVGFQMDFTNNSGSAVTFDVWIDTAGAPGATHGAGATKIIDGLTIPATPVKSRMSYAQSLSYITGLDRLKALAKEGKFEYYGEASVDGSFNVDSGKVIITVSGSK